MSTSWDEAKAAAWQDCVKEARDIANLGQQYDWGREIYALAGALFTHWLARHEPGAALTN